MFLDHTLHLPPDMCFKRADQPWEEEAIHRLNHRTFAGEIPQHEPRPAGRLVDRFHDSNVYQIAVQGTALVGMLALRFDRPFSVEQKVPESLAALPAGLKWCEVRLLSVDPRFRGSGLLAGLLRSALPVARDRGCDAALISATTRQLKLYGHMGFTAFGPLIGRGRGMVSAHVGGSGPLGNDGARPGGSGKKRTHQSVARSRGGGPVGAGRF